MELTNQASTFAPWAYWKVHPRREKIKGKATKDKKTKKGHIRANDGYTHLSVITWHKKQNAGCNWLYHPLKSSWAPPPSLPARPDSRLGRTHRQSRRWMRLSAQMNAPSCAEPCTPSPLCRAPPPPHHGRKSPSWDPFEPPIHVRQQHSESWFKRQLAPCLRSATLRWVKGW